MLNLGLQTAEALKKIRIELNFVFLNSAGVRKSKMAAAETAFFMLLTG